MTMLNPTLSRRTFLSGAAASAVVAVTHSAAGALLPPASLAVNALINETGAIAGLEAVLASPYLDLRAILLAQPHSAETRRSKWEEGRKKVASAVRGLLAARGTKVSVMELHQNVQLGPLFKRQLGLPMLVLGSFPSLWASWEATNQVGLPLSLAQLLRASPKVYIDDLPLAARIATASELAAHTVGGFCSSVDPTVDLALSHLRSGALGPITQVFTSLRVRDAANRLEARAIHQRLLGGTSPSSLPSLRLTGVASVYPMITLRGTRGQVQLALYTARDRHVMLPARLQRFSSVALGSTEL